MSQNFRQWLDAFVQSVKSGSTSQPPEAAVKPDCNDGIYFIRHARQSTEPVPRIQLSTEAAIAQGWRFRIKNKKRAKITQYRGNARDLIVPAQIGQFIINEIGGRVFANADLDSVGIPETVHKIGQSCFWGSRVQKIVISAPVSDIPQAFAKDCEQLSDVQLSPDTRSIHAEAFAGCKALQVMRLPRRVQCVERDAYKGSGLNAFFCFPDTTLSGSAFEDTPLDNKYKLLVIARSEKRYEIILVCRQGSQITLPPVQVCFAPQSVPNRKEAPRLLNCAQCTGVRVSTNAIGYTYDTNSGQISRKPLQMIVPADTSPFYYKAPVEVYEADGSAFPSYLTAAYQNDAETGYQYPLSVLPRFGLQPQERSVKIIAVRNSIVSYEAEAVCSRTLERISFDMQLCGSGRLFHDCCRHLQFAAWQEAEHCVVQQMQVYLPSAALIGEWAHWYLLGAFHGRMVQWDHKLFDAAVYDKLFTQQDAPKGRRVPETYSAWSVQKWEQAGVPCLNQKRRIILAIDVLRSTEKLFPNREMYRRYLLTHRRYAMKLCTQLPQEYGDFLRRFYEVME